MKTHLINAIVLSIFLLLALQSRSQSNLFDCDHSREFASHLFNTAQYDLALHELERVNYLCRPDSNSLLLLLKTYRKTNHSNAAFEFFNKYNFEELNQLNPDFRQEYIRLLMTEKQYTNVQQLITKDFDFKEKEAYHIGTMLLLEQWNEAYLLAQKTDNKQGIKLAGMKQIATQSHLAKRKSPFLATLMSVVLPGSGKMYSGFWADGAMPLLFTASSAFFAYRAFDKYGTQKVYPWIAGGIAVSYYTANIYGGNRAAILYNNNLNHSFIHETEHYLYADY
jgi:hypothetical protein